MEYRSGIGQDSHRFMEESDKPCVIGGLIFEEIPGFDANSDGDIVFHAICNAITTIVHVPILGGVADTLCLEDGITDSKVYLTHALQHLGEWQICHVALTIEALRPKIQARYDALRASVANALALEISQVGVMATTGEGLTAFGRGEGAQCFAAVTFSRHL